MHPMFLAVNAIVHQANVLGVFACNVRSAENYIPQKQHVAESATLTIVHFVARAARAYPDGGIDVNGSS